MKWVDLANQSLFVQTSPIEGEFPLSDVKRYRYGYRKWDETVPPLAPGNERLAQWFVQDPNDSTKAIVAVIDGSIAEREAREEVDRQAKAAEQAAYQALKEAVQAIEPAAIDKTPFADASQKATIQAIKDSVKAIKDSLKKLMEITKLP